MYFHTFNNPIGICIVINVSVMSRKLVYELSNYINYIEMHWEFTEIIVMKKKK